MAIRENVRIRQQPDELVYDHTHQANYPQQTGYPQQATWGYQSNVSDHLQMQMMQAEWARRAQACYLARIDDVNNSIVNSGFNGRFPEYIEELMPNNNPYFKNKQKGKRIMASNENDQNVVKPTPISYREVMDRTRGLTEDTLIIEDTDKWKKTKELLDKLARSVSIVYEKPSDVYTPDGTLNNKSFSYTKETTYLNLTDIPLFMQDNLNIISVIDPITNKHEWVNSGEHHTNSFIIVDTYRYPNMHAARKNLMLISNRFSNRYDEKFSHEAYALHKVLSDAIKNKESSHNGPILVRLKRAYSVTDHYKNRMYISSHDIVVTNKQENIYTPHPLSIEREIGKMEGEDSLPGKILDKPAIQSYKVEIELIDNDCAIGERYIYVFGQPVKIRPHKNPNKVDGAYMYNYLNGDKAKITPVFTPLEELESVHIYKTKEDAIHSGDPELRIKAINIETKELDKDMKISDNDYKVKLSDMTMNIEEMKKDALLANNKHTEEIKKYEVTNAVLKTVIGVTGTIAALIGIYNKFIKDGGFSGSSKFSINNF